MRIFLVAALVCFILALFSAAARTTIGIGALAWLAAGFVAWVLDSLVGSTRLN